MNPWDIVGWVAALGAALVIAAVVVLALVSIVREIVNPGAAQVKRAKSKRIDVS